MMQDNLTDDLVKRAAEAIDSLKAADAEGARVDSRKIQAHIDYGMALLDARTRLGNNAFGVWVREHGFDSYKPYDLQVERSAAIRMARVVVQNSGVLDCFADCPVTRPQACMRWFTEKHPDKMPTPLVSPGRPKMSEAVKAVRTLEERGEPVTSQRIMELSGVGETTALKALNEHRAAKDAAAKATAEVAAKHAGDLEQAQLISFEAHASEKSKLTLEKAIALHKKRLDQAFWPTVWAKVQEEIDKANDAMRKQNAELRAEVTALRQVLAANALFTEAEYSLLVKVAHPDNSASVETRNAAFDLIRKRKLRLVKE